MPHDFTSSRRSKGRALNSNADKVLELSTKISDLNSRLNRNDFTLTSIHESVIALYIEYDDLIARHIELRRTNQRDYIGTVYNLYELKCSILQRMGRMSEIICLINDLTGFNPSTDRRLFEIPDILKTFYGNARKEIGYTVDHSVQVSKPDQKQIAYNEAEFPSLNSGSFTPDYNRAKMHGWQERSFAHMAMTPAEFKKLSQSQRKNKLIPS